MRRGNEGVRVGRGECVLFEIVRPGMEDPNLQKNRKIQGSDQPARAAAKARSRRSAPRRGSVCCWMTTPSEGAASAVAVIVPSPLAGEGGSMLPRARMGEGCLFESNPPHPFEFVGTPLCPLPQGARALEASAAHFGETNPRTISPSGRPRESGTHDHRRWLWVPALRPLSRASAGTTMAWSKRRWLGPTGAPTCGCTK
jgi:hypothetical protein